MSRHEYGCSLTAKPIVSVLNEVGWQSRLKPIAAALNAGQMVCSGTQLYPSSVLGKKLQRYVWWDYTIAMPHLVGWMHMQMYIVIAITIINCSGRLHTWFRRR